MPVLKADPTPEELAQIIKLQINPAKLDYQAIVIITEKSIELIKSQYIKKTLENRKGQLIELEILFLSKKTILSQQQFLILSSQIEQLLQEANDKLLGALGISKQFFEQQLTALLSSGNEELLQQIIMLQQQLRQKLKLFLANKDQEVISIEKLKACLKEWKELVSDGVKRVLKAGNDEESNQLVNLVINTVLADLIWEKYGLEEENLANEAINTYVMQDFELQQALVDMQQESAKLLQECYDNIK